MAWSMKEKEQSAIVCGMLFVHARQVCGRSTRFGI
jgi:hypothetical protein